MCAECNYKPLMRYSYRAIPAHGHTHPASHRGEPVGSSWLGALCRWLATRESKRPPLRGACREAEVPGGRGALAAAGVPPRRPPSACYY